MPAVALVVLTLFAYSPAIPGQYIWDDDDYVHANLNLRHDAGLADIWFHPTHNPQYYPLVFTSFWLEWRIWGDQPAGYRIVNILRNSGGAVLCAGSVLIRRPVIAAADPEGLAVSVCTGVGTTGVAATGVYADG